MATMIATLSTKRPWIVKAPHADFVNGQKEFATKSEAAGWLVKNGFKLENEPGQGLDVIRFIRARF